MKTTTTSPRTTVKVSYRPMRVPNVYNLISSVGPTKNPKNVLEIQNTRHTLLAAAAAVSRPTKLRPKERRGE